MDVEVMRSAIRSPCAIQRNAILPTCFQLIALLDCQISLITVFYKAPYFLHLDTQSQLLFFISARISSSDESSSCRQTYHPQGVGFEQRSRP